MTLKVVVLQSREQLISNVKEIVSEDKVVAYLLDNPHRLDVSTFTAETSVEVTLSPWILASADKEIPIPNHHVVAIVEPLDSIKEMYYKDRKLIKRNLLLGTRWDCCWDWSKYKEKL